MLSEKLTSRSSKLVPGESTHRRKGDSEEEARVSDVATSTQSYKCVNLVLVGALEFSAREWGEGWERRSSDCVCSDVSSLRTQ